MNRRYEKLFLALLAGVHFVVVAIHGYSHFLTGTPNTPWQTVFILFVVMLAPPLSAYYSWKYNLRKGAFLFSASMFAAFIFGYFFHFFYESPDLHANVHGSHKELFFHSALDLAILEFAGFVSGIIIWLNILAKSKV